MIAFLITFTFVDLFQVKDTAQHGSFDQFNRYFAETYPKCIPKKVGDIFDCLLDWPPPDDSETPSGPEVSVVLWTDAMLQTASMTWPIRMEDHARVLETILPLKPKGVLVDLFFLDDPDHRGDESLQDLIDVICDYQEQETTPDDPPPTRMYLVAPSTDPETPITPKLTEGLETECGLYLNGPEGTGSDAKTPIVTKVSARLTHSPARIYYGSAAASKIFSDFFPDVDLKDFHIFWSHNPNQGFLGEQYACMKDDEFYPDNILNVFGKIIRPVYGALLGIVNKSVDGLPCPYAPMIPAHVMHCLRAAPLDDEKAAGFRIQQIKECNLTPDKDEAAASDEAPTLEKYLEIKRAVEDKYVLYGADLHGLGDLYEAPIHGKRRLSGVFIHAMALDNLLETRGNVHHVKHERTASQTFLYYVFSAFLATVTFLLVKYTFFDLWHRVVSRVHEPETLRGRTVWLLAEFGFWLVIVIAAGGILMFLAWASYLLGFLYAPFRFGVLNWVGILLVSGLLSVWVKMPFVFELAYIIEQYVGKRRARKSVKRSMRGNTSEGAVPAANTASRTPTKRGSGSERTESRSDSRPAE